METSLVRDAIRALRERLPEGWRVESEAGAGKGRERGADAVATITAPDRRVGKVWIEAKTRVSPKDALLIAGVADLAWAGAVLVVSPFLSKSTRDRLREEKLNWLDLTGNLRLVLRRPGLFIETQGDERRVGGGKGPARTLKGQTAGRVVQAMLTAAPPVGVIELAQRAGTDPGYTSRVLELLDTEALVERERRGPITKVNRARLVRRWAEDAPLAGRGRVESFLDPRGIGALMDKLRGTRLRYAITGSVAAQQWAPIAAPRLAQVYVREGLEKSAEELGLRPAREGANVQLIRPKDLGIVDSARRGNDGLYYAKPLQVVVDLLTSPGRAPSEGEELLEWMSERPDVWA